MKDVSLLSKQDIKDEVKNMPKNIYETNLLAVNSIPKVEHIKRLTSIVDKHIKK